MPASPKFRNVWSKLLCGTEELTLVYNPPAPKINDFKSKVPDFNAINKRSTLWAIKKRFSYLEDKGRSNSTITAINTTTGNLKRTGKCNKLIIRTHKAPDRDSERKIKKTIAELTA